MRLGLAQMKIVTLDVAENAKTCERFFQQAREQQVDLLLFPEMTLTGFARDVEQMLPHHEEIFALFQQWTSQHQVPAAFGYACALTEAERAANPQAKPAYNRLCLMEDGVVRLTYDKIHPFSRGFEGGNYEPGNTLGYTQFHGWGIGAFLCYDLRFPAFFSLLGEACQLILLPANWPDFRIDAWETLACARALENQCYVAAVNRVGQDEKSFYSGHSAVFDPFGKRLTPISQREELLIADLELGRVDQTRSKIPQLQDRREVLFLQLLQARQHQEPSQRTDSPL